MRMWSADPKKMCRRHLLGEHAEMHMFAGTINSGKSVDGYIKKNLLDPRSIECRHDILAKEMLARGYKHNSPIYVKQLDYPIRYLNTKESLRDLLERCDECRRLHAP